MKVVGYADRFSVRAGERIGCALSSVAGDVAVRVVRLRHGDVRGPGLRETFVADLGSVAAVERPIRTGSCAVVPDHAGRLAAITSVLSVGVFVCLTRNDGDEARGLVTWGPGHGLTLLGDGRVRFAVEGCAVESAAPLRAGAWYLVAGCCHVDTATMSLCIEAIDEWCPALDERAARSERQAASSTGIGDGVALAPRGDVVFGAILGSDRFGPCTVGHINGKLESPWIGGAPLTDADIAAVRAGVHPRSLPGVVAAWDFSVGIGDRQVCDVSGSELHGRLVNMPTRAVTGWRWARREVDWRLVPAQYGAIHFHDDDLDDVEWPFEVTWDAPADTASGIYAFHLTVAGFDRAADAYVPYEHEDYVPFFLLPAVSAPRASVAFLVPTFSYLAYANEHVATQENVKAALSALVDYPVQPGDQFVVRHRLNSTYDRHSDGSGVCYSSRLRPILNMRPLYHQPVLNLGEGGAHQFNADLHLVDWLSEVGYPFDVVTDDELHRYGAAALAGYRTVITGTHAEYCSGAMLDALEQFLADGGRLMYLTGNGFEWVAEPDPDHPHTVEVRRCGTAGRGTWSMPAGEGHQTSTGELGGLWRARGRAPHRLVGVGTTALGNGPGRGFVRTAASYEDQRVAFVFGGVAGDTVGDIPCLVNEWGAAGFELDRTDARLGTPPNAVVLATASGFSPWFQYVPDEVALVESGRPLASLMRADMVFFETPAGGAVFSASGQQWSSCLSYNDYDNDVSRVTLNVLRRFDDPTPFAVPGCADRAG